MTAVLAVFIFLWQIFLICFFGQEAITEFSLLPLQLYSSNWPGMIVTFKRSNSKDIIQFMMALNRENSIMIGKVFRLDLTTFNSVNHKIFSILTKFQFHFAILGLINGLSTLCFN